MTTAAKTAHPEPSVALSTLAHAALEELERVIVGKRDSLALIMIAIISGGHVLIEDLPGLGKTLIARSFATALGLSVTRVQFTPDLLPADLLGATVYDMRSGSFEYRPGPVFTNILLADEINRTPPKTQAALLECMAENQVSIDGTTHRLPSPFIVLATENPIELEGTYSLPEAQMDRFAIRVRLGYLSEVDEEDMLCRRLQRGYREPRPNPVLDIPLLLSLRDSVENVSVHSDIVRYVVLLVRATRDHPHVEVGASPRAELDLLQLARSRAFMFGRDYVLPEDVKSLAVPALAHRLSLRPEMWVRRIRAEDVIDEIVGRVPAPRAPSSALSGVGDLTHR